MRWFNGTPTIVGNLTPKQVEQLSVLLSTETHQEVDRVTYQHQTTLNELLKDNQNSWTIQEILKKK